MRRISSLTFALLILTAFGLRAASAQITIKIPDIPRVKKPKAELPRSAGGDNSPADDRGPNSQAPPDYNANLNVNDMAVAVDHLGLLSAVRIVAKSGNRYKATGAEHPNHTYWYNANSVYPFFDRWVFAEISNSRQAEYLAPYLECYAKKHNLELIKVTGNAFHPPRYNNAKEMKQDLQAELPKLAELSALLNSKLQARPNTFLNYRDNPAVWEDITSNRDQYLQCAVGQKESLRASESVWLRAHMDNIAEKQKEVEAFAPNTKLYLVSASTYDYLLFAVSPRARAEWLSGDSLEFKPNLDPVLDALAASAAKKLPIYIPSAENFAIHNPLEERMMKSQMGNLAALKIHKLGLAHGVWQISKNEFGIPTARFKRGYAWVRVATDDHPYCRLYQVNIIQDYAGGGTYGASYAKFLGNTLQGCP